MEMNQAELGKASEDYPLHQSIQNSMGMRKSKSNMKLGANQTVNQSMATPDNGSSRQSLFESNVHKNAYEENRFHTKKNSLKQNVGPIHFSDYRSNHKRKDSYNSCY